MLIGHISLTLSLSLSLGEHSWQVLKSSVFDGRLILVSVCA